MPNVDQFESLFRAAERDVFDYRRIPIESVLVVTDRTPAGARAFGDRVRRFLKAIDQDAARWRDVAGDEFRTAGELIDLTEAARPDLMCAYRNLHSSAWKWPYSLGTHLDLLTQHTQVPVLVLPHPDADRSARHANENLNVVMAITDRLTGDARLVNYAVRFTEPGGTLWLTHVEDEITFERYLSAISKIPTLDTDEARRTLRERLIEEPRAYIAGCRQALLAANVPLTVEKRVTFGYRVREYRRLIDQHEVDLLVFNTKHEDQLAMHGIAYELAVELRRIPLLML